MVIGTTAAILGSAVIAGGASVAASKKNSKAISKASAAQQTSDAQQIAYQREAYAKNEAALSPYMQRGNVAGQAINDLLGLGGSTVVPQQGLPTPQGALTVPWQGYNPDSSGGVFGMPRENTSGDAAWLQRPMGNAGPYDQSFYGSGFNQQVTQAAPAQTPQQAAMAAYDIFKQSTGYTSRLKEGMGALNAGYFGGGIGQSGAAVKAALRYGQDYASGEFGKYLGYLGNQQGVGFSGASALAGVSQGFADRLSDISQNGANTASQAAIARAGNNGALMTGLAGIAGNAVGALSSYGRMPAGVPTYGGGLNTPIYPSTYGYGR